MRNIIDYISIIKTNLDAFTYVIVEIKDYRGISWYSKFDRNKDVAKKCVEEANRIGDGNIVTSIRCFN